MSNDVKVFCNNEAAEIIKPPVNNHCVTRCVERTIGSLKSSIIKYAGEKNQQPMEKS